MPSVLSTFSGLGGLDLGLEAAGFDVVGCLETSEIARRSLASNRPDWLLLEPHDVTQWERVLEGIDADEVDLISGGPPCQPFSKAAQWSARSRTGLEDDRAKAVVGYLRLVEALLPRAILIENVPGFVSGRTNAVPFLQEALDELNNRTGASYRLETRVLKADAFGVPQARRRAILVAFRDGSGFRWPKPTTPDDPVTAWDAIGSVDSADPPSASGKWADLLPCIPEGMNYQWLTADGGGAEVFGKRTKFWSFLLKLAKDRPSWTIPAAPGPATGPFHWENRPLSTEESLRLQSFPASWVVSGSFRAQQRQVGNATPPLLAEILGWALLGQLDGSPTPDEYRLSVERRAEPPAPAPVAALPAKFEAMVGEHAPHPGTGLGPAPVLDPAGGDDV